MLSHRAFVPGVIFAGTLLMAGAINNGFLLDDYLHQLMIGEDESLVWIKTAPWDVFRLIPSDPAFVQKSIETGINPWWGSEDYQATFFRPISSLTMYIDHLLWPDSPMMMHLHSLLWFVVMCMAAFRLFLRILPERYLAALATGFFALDDAHMFPAAWIANRNALISTTLAFLVLWLHMRWRRDNWRPGAFTAPFMLAVALLAGEFALGICGFLFAHVMFMEKGTWRQKLSRLMPYGAVVIVWRVIYNLMGYGVWGSDLYVDPLRSPWSFLEMVILRLPVLLGSGFGLGGAEVSTFIPDGTHPILTGASLTVVLFFGWALKPKFKKNACLQFLLTGTILSLIPSCATFAHDRLLLIASLGIFSSIAIFVQPFLESNSAESTGLHYGNIRWIIPSVWLVLHGVISPASLPFKTEIPSMLNNVMMATTRSLPKQLDGKTVVIVAAPDMFASTFLPLWRHAFGLTMPTHTVTLYNGVDTLTVIRETQQSLVFEVREGMLGVWTDALVRRRADRFEVGQQIERATTLFTVLAVDKTGNPTRVRATFYKPLNDEKYSFWYWTPTAYRRFDLPDRGEEKSIRIDAFEILFPKRTGE